MGEDVAEFVTALYDLGGFESWGEFGRAAGFAPATMSDWKRGENAPSGPNLLRLIHAATDRAPLAMRKAAEGTSPVAQLQVRLEALASADERTRAALMESLASIDARLSQIEGWLAPPDAQDSEAQ